MYRFGLIEKSRILGYGRIVGIDLDHRQLLGIGELGLFFLAGALGLKLAGGADGRYHVAHTGIGHAP